MKSQLFELHHHVRPITCSLRRRCGKIIFVPSRHYGHNRKRLHVNEMILKKDYESGVSNRGTWMLYRLIFK